MIRRQGTAESGDAELAGWGFGWEAGLPLAGGGCDLGWGEDPPLGGG
jgi:hypothetical protein